MPFFKKIMMFFESIFNRSSPEVQKRIQKKRMEANIATFTPVLYRNGNITANFAEALHILYLNSRYLDNLFSETIGSSDIQRQMRFRMQLVFTGFSPEEQDQLESLSYENRKEEVADEKENLQKRIYDQQHSRLERIIHALNGDEFKAMDKTIADLHQFADLCHINFVEPLQKFDPNFVAGDPNYKPTYRDVPIANMMKTIEDIYYHVADLHISNTTANVIMALLHLRYGDALTQDQRNGYITCTKKIASVVNHVLKTDNLKAIIQLAKENTEFEPAKAEYKESVRHDFAAKIQEQFKADEQRIRNELKDEKIRMELFNLFGEADLLPVKGYTQSMNEKLHENTPLDFTWIMPLQVLKTFLSVYLSPQVHAVLNDIVVEGFFNSQSFKSDFSEIVYAALEAQDHVQLFEQTFEQGKQNDTSLLEGYLTDSRKDASFYKRMEKMVTSVNNQAKALIQDEVTALRALYSNLADILADAKKPGSELIQNLKVLLLSPRNKDNTDLLERQFPNWRVFFEIMSNYVMVSIKDGK